MQFLLQYCKRLQNLRDLDKTLRDQEKAKEYWQLPNKQLEMERKNVTSLEEKLAEAKVSSSPSGRTDARTDLFSL